MYFASSNIAATRSGVIPSKNNCQTTSALLGIPSAPDLHGINSRILRRIAGSATDGRSKLPDDLEAG